MDFIVIANAWSAGRDNPTSKHRIALELAARGHRVLWIEGSGMRAPSMGSGHDRLRMVKKVWAALRGARREEVRREETLTPALSPEGRGSGLPSSPFRGEDRGEGHYLWVLSPLFIPLPRYEVIRCLNGVICRWSLRYWGWRLGFRDPVMINYVPVLAEGMRGGASGKRDAARGMRYGQLSDGPVDRAPVRSIYHCVDRWDQFDMYDSAMMTEMDRRCCVYADLVIASSTDLYTRCRRLNPNTVMITHGVDWEHFRQAASGMREEGSGKRQAAGGEPHPVIGFFGLLSEWVDQELILKLAAEFSGATHPLPLQGGEPHPLIPAQGVGSAPALIPSLEGQGVGSSPRADIVLIGKADVPVTRLQGIANIHLLGPKPFAELPSHIARFTVGVIPFVVNDLTRAVNPIKLREMLAAGCPVVSSALPEVEKFEKRGSVFVAHNADEFVAMVREAIAHPLTTEQRLALSDSMASETWAGKVEEILKLVARGEP